MLFSNSKSTFSVISNRYVKCIDLILPANYSLDEDKVNTTRLSLVTLKVRGNFKIECSPQ